MTDDGGLLSRLSNAQQNPRAIFLCRTYNLKPITKISIQRPLLLLFSPKSNKPPPPSKSPAISHFRAAPVCQKSHAHPKHRQHAGTGYSHILMETFRAQAAAAHQSTAANKLHQSIARQNPAMMSAKSKKSSRSKSAPALPAQQRNMREMFCRMHFAKTDKKIHPAPLNTARAIIPADEKHARQRNPQHMHVQPAPRRARTTAHKNARKNCESCASRHGNQPRNARLHQQKIQRRKSHHRQKHPARNVFLRSLISTPKWKCVVAPVAIHRELTIADPSPANHNDETKCAAGNQTQFCESKCDSPRSAPASLQ